MSLITITAALVLALVFPAYAESPTGEREDSSTNASRRVALPDAAEWSSNLPLIMLDTLGQTVTNFGKMPAWVTIIDTTNGRSSLTGVRQYNGHAGVSLRGNSSRSHPKKPYRLELQDEHGKDLKASLLGMPAESDWILYPAYTDKTMVRDVLAFELWRAMGYYAPRTRHPVRGLSPVCAGAGQCV